MHARRAIVVATLGFALGACVTLFAMADEQQDPQIALIEKRLAVLLEERVKSAERATQAMQAAYASGTVTLDCVHEAYNTLLVARLEAAKSDKQRMASLQEHLLNVSAIEEAVERLFKTGSRGGETNSYESAKRERQTAEIALRREELRQATKK